MKNKLYIGLTAISVITFSYWSCKKANPTADNQDITSVSDNAQVDETLTDVSTNINSIINENPDLLSGDLTKTTNAEAAAGGTASTSGLGGNPQTSTPCATISVTPTNNTWPKTITIDYGSGCINTNGVARQGQIIVTLSGPLTATTSAMTATFSNYVVNGTSIVGTRVTTKSRNTSGNLIFSHVSTIHLINASLSLNVTHNSTRVFEWITGADTPSRLDDIFSITGSGSGTNSRGNSFTTLITKPLIKKVICPFIVSGTIQVTETPSNWIRVLDYGDGTCDNLATITINGVSKPIRLRK